VHGDRLEALGGGVVMGELRVGGVARGLLRLVARDLEARLQDDIATARVALTPGQGCVRLFRHMDHTGCHHTIEPSVFLWTAK
jgi:hypothetical protein